MNQLQKECNETHSELDQKTQQYQQLPLKYLKLEENFSKLFSKTQIRRLSTRFRAHWSNDDISSAMTLYSAGSREYRLLRKRGFPLPAPSTLGFFSSLVQIIPGCLKVVLPIIQRNLMTPMDGVCVLCFDEMIKFA